MGEAVVGLSACQALQGLSCHECIHRVVHFCRHIRCGHRAGRPAGLAPAPDLVDRRWRDLPADADKVKQRFGAGNSAQHPLVRLSGLNLTRQDTGMLLELEPLTEWLARRVGLPYMRIDPSR